MIRLTSRRSRRRLALRLRAASRVGGGSAFGVRQHYETRTTISSAFLDYQHSLAVAVPLILAYARGTKRGAEWFFPRLHDFGGVCISSRCQRTRRAGSCSAELEPEDMAIGYSSGRVVCSVLGGLSAPEQSARFWNAPGGRRPGHLV